MKYVARAFCPVTSNHHRQDADDTLSLKFPTQVSALSPP